MNLKKPQTLKDIAELCGVSRQAVSAALGLAKSNNTRISEEKKEHILAVVKQHNFRPHRAAQKLQSRRHDSYGLLVGNLCRISMPTMVQLLDVVREREKFLVVDSFLDGAETSRFLEEDSVDAIVTFDDLSDALHQRIMDSGIPSISVNNNDRQTQCTIIYDEADAVDQAINYLLSKGRKKIAFIHKQSGHYSMPARLAAYEAAVATGKIPENLQLFVDGEIVDEELAAFLQAHPAIDGFILSHSGDAVTVHRVLTAQGRDLNADQDIVGFFWPGRHVNLRPRIATLGVNQRNLATAIVDAMDALIAGRDLDQSSVLPYELDRQGAIW